MGLLELSQLRYLIHHRLQTLLAILGIALGVAVVNAVDITHYSAKQNLRHSVQQLGELATHRVVGVNKVIDETIYAELRRKLLSKYPSIKLLPIISSTLRGNETDAQRWQLIGIDPLSSNIFKGLNIQQSNSDFTTFISRNNAVLISQILANERKLGIGDELTLALSSRSIVLFVAGIIDTENKQLLVTDISHAQSILSLQGWLSYIDIIIPNSQPELTTTIAQTLPSHTQLLNTQQLVEGQLSLISALEFNLSALSLLAVVVGTLLIFSTVRFSVLQRTPTFSRLRVQGVSHQQLQQLLLKEALLLATLGITLGWLLGFLLSQVLAPITNRTISDLYSSQSATQTSYHWSLYIKTAALGLLTTLATSQLCYRQTKQLALSHTIARIQQEINHQQYYRWQLTAALLLGSTGLLLLNQNNNSLSISYSIVLLIVSSALLLLPIAVTLMYPALQKMAQTLFGVTGLIAMRDCQRESSRVLLAIIALCLAVAATNGIATMIGSFRGSVNQWIESQLGADIYIQGSINASEAPTNHQNIDMQLVGYLQNHADIDHLFISRITRTFVDNKWLPLNAIETTEGSHPGTPLQLITGDPAQALKKFNRGQLLISEPLSRKKNLRAGDTLTLHTATGHIDFIIAGIIRDYGAEHGRIVVHRQYYQQLWQDKHIDRIGLFLHDPQQKSRLLAELEDSIANNYSLRLVDSDSIKKIVLMVFDRTFTITQVLQVLVLIIAVIAIISTLMMYQLQRREQLLTLRALGMTISELRQLFVLQACFIGGMAGLLAIPLGILIAWLLVQVINPAAFGWTLDFQHDPSISLTGFTVALLAGLLSAVYPSLHFGKAINITELNRE
ncbi:MAG: FtsX-like permease family protein [Pseudomonadales bacterium]